MDRVEALANRLADTNWLWWPYLRLRPPRERPMSARYVAALTACYCHPLLVAILLLLLFRWQRLSQVSVGVLVATMVLTYVGCFAVYLQLARFWNRRAARLALSEASPR